MPSGRKPLTFDPNDEESWFFGFMSRAEATELLSDNKEDGTFLVRESTTAKGDLVLSVKEKDEKVSHYIINRVPAERGEKVNFKIGDQTFHDIPSLLKFYKLNKLDDTSLRVPAIPTHPLNEKRSFTKDYLAEVQKDCMRNALLVPKIVPISLYQRKLPRYAKVVQTRIPNAYDKTALTLKEGEIVQVTKTDISGRWEGEICGRKGHFPFNYVEFIKDPTE